MEQVKYYNIDKVSESDAENIFVYDIEMKNNHYFMANNLAIHNCCLTADTYISVRDKGTAKEMLVTLGGFLKDVGYGSHEIKKPRYQIKGMEPLGTTPVYSDIIGILKKPYKGVIYTFYVNNNLYGYSLKCTPDHIFYVRADSSEGELPAEEIYKLLEERKEVDLLVVKDNKVSYSKIYEYEKKEMEIDVYDVEMKEHHYFFGNHILSHNCRLRNAVEENDFSYSLGAGGVETGSHSVMTINLNRLFNKAIYAYLDKTPKERDEVRDWIEKNREEAEKVIFEKTEELVHYLHKFQYAHRMIVKEYIDAGLYSAYSAGFIHLNKQFSTLGLNGLNEACEFLGYECSNNQEYKDFISRLFSLIKDLNYNARKDFNGAKYNTELVPAENLGVKNCEWDKKDGYYVGDRICYNSYIYLPESDNTSIPDKFILHGESISNHLDGEYKIAC